MPAARLNVSPAMTVTPRSTRVGLSITWTPDADAQVQVGAGVNVAFFETAAGNGLRDATFGLAVSDQLTPESRISGATDLHTTALGYSYRGPLQADVAASTAGVVSAQIQGRVRNIFAASVSRRR